MEVDQTQSPVIIDFENGEMMARLLATPDFEPSRAEPSKQEFVPASAVAGCCDRSESLTLTNTSQKAPLLEGFLGWQTIENQENAGFFGSPLFR